MFGWEFPPHISGGLGTACHGLASGLSRLEDVELTFVVPRSVGDENNATCHLIGANQVRLDRRSRKKKDSYGRIELLTVSSDIIPYQTPEQFWKAKSKRYLTEKRFVEVDEEGRIEFSGGYGLSLFREIRDYAMIAAQIAGDASFDVIHAHDWPVFPAGIAASGVSGKPLVLHVHATEFDRSGGDVDTRIFSIEKEGMEAADRIIAVSNLTRRIIIEKYGIPPGKVITVYNAVETISEEEISQYKKGLRGKIITFLGRITLQKGPEYFVEAAALVLKKIQDIRFVMAGSGDRLSTVIEQVARLGISDKFHFTGFLQHNEVARLLRMSHVFVMPSVSEPFGIVPLEAMRLGVPVIISRQSGVSEILKNVIKTDCWDTFAIADAIYGLLNYPALRELLVMKGWEEAGNLSWDHVAREVYAIYKDVTVYFHKI